MEIVDKDFKNGFVAAFQYAVKVVSYYLNSVETLLQKAMWVCVCQSDH